MGEKRNRDDKVFKRYFNWLLKPEIIANVLAKQYETEDQTLDLGAKKNRMS